LALIIIPVFAILNRPPRRPGFYLIAFAALYLPVRFALDLVRVSDARYLRLTPAQWVAALTLAALPLATMNRRKFRFIISGIVILATAWACWGGPR
jgi:prolipoprotein diacylglyceryltransferase